MSRWAEGIIHHDDGASQFVTDYFASSDRSVLLIAAAGFDPRSTTIARLIAKNAKKVHGFFVREERHNANPILKASAAENVELLQALIPSNDVLSIEIFHSQDGAV